MPPAAMTRWPRPQERCARWLLWLSLLHTVPVVWLTPVSGGTAPTAVLLAFGFANLFTFDREGVTLGLFALGPALAYCAIGWGLAWLGGKGLAQLRQPLRAILLGLTALGLLVSVYWPIYAAGGHTSSRNVDLIDLVDDTLPRAALLAYWIVLHAVLAAFYVGSLLRGDHPALHVVERWRKPTLVSCAIALAAALLYGNAPILLCRPLAELGSARAALCVARSDDSAARHWYTRAGEGGQAEAIAWLIDHTGDREGRLYWLRKGAAEGDATIQFALYEQLAQSGGSDSQAEAEQWLRRAADQDHVAAMLVLVDVLSQTIYDGASDEVLAERNAWLEQAAALGAREAKRRLAEHYVDGSLGHPADLDRARAYYAELASIDAPASDERSLGLNATAYRARLTELDAWAAGLARGDPTVMNAFAERYLESPRPGPGVRAKGQALLEQLAADGDAAARERLIVGLRTGTGGIEQDLDDAKTWLLRAAEAGDVDAMERVADNYLNERDGFPRDYAEARRWLDALIAQLAASGAPESRGRIANLRRQLAHIDSLAERADGVLLGERALEQLGQRTDAESHYRYALQLLAGHGAARRAEAIARLEEASRLGHGDAAWRLVEVYERGYPDEINPVAARAQLERAANAHHFEASRELALTYESGKRGFAIDLPQAIARYEALLAAGHDNRYGWNLDPAKFDHFPWLESRLRQARLKLEAQAIR